MRAFSGSAWKTHVLDGASKIAEIRNCSESRWGRGDPSCAVTQMIATHHAQGTFPEALDAIRNVRRLPRRSHLHSRANFKGL